MEKNWDKSIAARNAQRGLPPLLSVTPIAKRYVFATNANPSDRSLKALSIIHGMPHGDTSSQRLKPLDPGGEAH